MPHRVFRHAGGQKHSFRHICRLSPQINPVSTSLYTKKKRESLYPLLIPLIKALALPSLVERATQKPTPICIMTLECTFDRQRRTKDINIPRRHLLLLCFGWILEFAKFCRAKNKTSSKRLFYICIFPTSLTSLRKYRRGKRGKDSNLINRTKIYSAIFSDVS